MQAAKTLKQLQLQYLINSGSSFNAERIKLEYIDMIKQANPDYFITLTFAYDVSRDRAINALEACMWHVNKKVFGRGIRDKINRLKVLPFIENNAISGVHLHLLVNQPNNKQDINLQKIFRQKWQAINVHGFATFKQGEWFKKIDKIDGIAKYITKQTHGDNRPLVIECLNY